MPSSRAAEQPSARARMRRCRFDVRYTLWTVGCAGVALAALVTCILGWSGWRWEAAQGAGLAAAVVCLLLCAWPVRPREAQPPTLLTLRAHGWLGWTALGSGVRRGGCTPHAPGVA